VQAGFSGAFRFAASRFILLAVSVVVLSLMHHQSALGSVLIGFITYPIAVLVGAPLIALIWRVKGSRR
jgi:hypothetical protein